ncbi:MAG: outer membrane protein assembly factor BamA, partial [Devosiaceae bacterium]|nr:outer membrane protein assembly factor BamA [Devosiaceae bacterium MH13]
GQTYDASAVDRSIEALTLEVSSLGYAFVSVRPRGDRNPADATIDLTYFVDEGVRTYVERINISGNTRTRDYVIRREFDFAEGDPFNRVLLDRAERRLNALGFFERVRITTAQGSAPDRVILNVQVVEKSTGDVSLGGGYSTVSGFTAELSITEQNFLGRGQFVRAAVGGGFESNRTYDFSFTEPYFLGRRLAAGFDLYRRESGETGDDVYTTIANGGGLRVVAPLTNNLSFGLGYGFDVTEYNLEATQDNVSAAIEQLVGAQIGRGGAGSPLRNREYSQDRTTSSVTWSLTYDTVDSRVVPRDGYFARLRQTVAGLGGDAKYVETTFDSRVFYTVSTDLDVVASARFQAGNIWSWDDDNLLLVDAFYQGGGLVRGFDSIGPRDTATRDALGATTYAGISAELNMPVPILPESFGMRTAIFADAGTAFGTVGSVDNIVANVTDDNAIRSSVGASLIWQSPFGPLRADYAYVLSKGDLDEEQAFRFSAGARF